MLVSMFNEFSVYQNYVVLFKAGLSTLQTILILLFLFMFFEMFVYSHTGFKPISVELFSNLDLFM